MLDPKALAPAAGDAGAAQSIAVGLGAGPARAPLVFVLILNYGSLDDTLACVDGVRASGYANLRLLVIDNASPDGSGRELARQLPSHEFMQLPRNTGYAGGNNTGIRVALQEGARFVLILNPDVRLHADAIERYLEVFAADASVGALNSIQLEADGQTIDRRFREAVLRPAGVDATRFSPECVPHVLEVGRLFGAALMISRAALEQVGGFDPLYFAYGEETDLCRRLRARGWKLVVTRQAPVIHLRSSYSSGISPRVAFLRLKGYYLNEMKDPSRSFVQGYARTMRELLSALQGRPPARYPFDTMQFTRGQLLHAMSWFVVHGVAAWRHKRLERHRRMYV